MNAPSISSECEKAHGANWRKWLGHLKDKPASGLELGSWIGESAEWMLDNIFTHTGSIYCCVDTFLGSEEHHLAGLDCANLESQCRTRLERFGERANITKARSHEHGWTTAFDFVYVDAAHDAMSVLRDGVRSFDLLKVGGVMIFDDYEWEVMPDPIDRPKPGIDAFIECYGRRLDVLGVGWQVAVRKTA